VVRPVRERRVHGLRKVLGVGALYSIGYGNVGSSIYYAMGIAAVYALGATPVVLAIAGLLFAFTALTYAEGSTMIPEAGGAASFARHGFNDLVSFVAGWALMLDFIVIIAISAITVPSYLAYFFPVLKRSPAAAWVGIGVIVVFMVLNVLGVKQTSGVNLAFCVLDLVTQAALLIVGSLLLLNPKAILAALPGGGAEVWAAPDRFLYSISIAMVAYIGLESISQMAEEARDVARSIPRALLLALATIVVMHTGISTVALSAMRPQDLATQWSTDPVAGIAQHLPTVAFQSEVVTFRVALNRLTAPWVAVLASSILMIAMNAGILGVSRLAFSMSLHQQLPSPLVRLHRVFRTPYIAILCFCMVAITLLLPSFSAPDILLKLGDLYSFGAMLAFTIAHASIIALRFRAPDLPRPFRPWGEIPLAGRRVPVSALLGFLTTFAAWVVVIVTHRFGRLVGFLWLLGGVAIYALYRRRKGLPLMARPAGGGRPSPAPAGMPLAAAPPERR
jgi:APA family basic amino acid/polyamine antiporter